MNAMAAGQGKRTEDARFSSAATLSIKKREGKNKKP